ncbi:hypothetical protein ACVWWR_001542 [Bradyrhizobium sp. LM3.2]
MMSAGVSSFASADLPVAGFSTTGAGFGLGGARSCASAEASWNVAAIDGLARGVGTGSAGLTAEATTVGAAGFAAGAGAPSSSSSLLVAAGAGLPLNNATKKFGLLPASSPLPRRSMSALASS